MNPLDYIWIALVLTFCTLSVYSLTREGQLLGWLRNGFLSIVSNKMIRKPFFECPPCMASVWGSTFYWWIFAGSIQEWIVCVLISSILNKIIYGYVE